MSWLDRWLGKNPWCPISFATFSNVAMYCFQRIMERVSSPNEKSTDDFLDNFIAAKSENPDVVTDNEVVSYLMMNVLAGADTTALVEKAIVHHILSNPRVQEKLCAELDGAGLSFPPQYSETKDLPYLSAVIREGQRMHPVISGILERIVPARGLTLPDGRFIAPGTRVGINAWVSHRNKDVYGADADSFRPERWLRATDETEDAFAARLARMKDGDMTFGAGSRQCVGRHLATLELHKLTSALFSRYNVGGPLSRRSDLILPSCGKLTCLVLDLHRQVRQGLHNAQVVVYLLRPHQREAREESVNASDSGHRYD